MLVMSVSCLLISMSPQGGQKRVVSCKPPGTVLGTKPSPSGRAASDPIFTKGNYPKCQSTE